MSHTFVFRKLYLLLGLWLIVLSIPVTVQAQTDTVETDTVQAELEPLNPARNYLGVALSTVAADEGTPIAVQFGVDVLERLELRGVLSNFSNLFASAETLYRLNPSDAFGQPYLGGGVTVTGVPSESNPAETEVALLPTLTGGYGYRFGVLGVFAELRVFVSSLLPTPELRTGVNVHF